MIQSLSTKLLSTRVYQKKQEQPCSQLLIGVQPPSPAQQHGPGNEVKRDSAAGLDGDKKIEMCESMIEGLFALQFWRFKKKVHSSLDFVVVYLALTSVTGPGARSPSATTFFSSKAASGPNVVRNIFHSSSRALSLVRRTLT